MGGAFGAFVRSTFRQVLCHYPVPHLTAIVSRALCIDEKAATGRKSGEAKPSLQWMTQPLCLFGHTHIATDYEEVDIAGKKYFLEETPLQHDDRIEMEASHKYLVNWGSCGQLRDNNPWVRYALLDTGARVIEVLAVDYDVEAARDAIMKASLSPHLGDRLRSGT